MQHNDDVVSGWLDGSDTVGGYDNPAGPLFIQGHAATEAALTSPKQALITGGNATRCSTTASAVNHCLCC